MSTKKVAENDAKEAALSESEATKCVCGADDSTVIIESIPSGRLVRCNRCGLHYSNPRLLARMIRNAADGDRFQEIDEDKVKEPKR